MRSSNQARLRAVSRLIITWRRVVAALTVACPACLSPAGCLEPDRLDHREVGLP